MRLPKFDKAATATLIAASVIVVAGAFMLTPWSTEGKGKSVEQSVQARTQTPAERPVVEVVFALDTTGSMSGLIESAKQKIWGITNHLMSGQPRPDVRIGLVFYRDTSDAYVTESMALTSDIDAVYQRLLTANASGGGDNPEHVNKALDIAINEMQWKSGDKVLKLVFLVGDAPPHDDYTDVPTSTELAKAAAKKGIIINTIRAGGQQATAVAWQAIASASQGQYASIAQDGGTVAVRTPFDRELERYNSELADSSISFGAPAARATAKMRMDNRRAMSGETAAAAASVSGRKGGHLGSGDFLSALEDGEADLDAPDDAAPEAMRGMSKDQKVKWVEGKRNERKALAKKISKLSSKREAFLKKNKPKKADSFDDNVADMLKEQSKKIGVEVD